MVLEKIFWSFFIMSLWDDLGGVGNLEPSGMIGRIYLRDH